MKLGQGSDDRDSRYWFGLSILFLLCAADEFITFHEYLSGPVRKFLGTSGWLYYAWIVPYALVLLVVCLVYLRFFLRFTPRFRWRFGLAAAVFLAGGMGLEMAGGRLDELAGRKTLAYVLMVAAEEGLEMAGIVLLIDALIRYLGERYGTLTLRFGPGPDVGGTANVSSGKDERYGRRWPAGNPADAENDDGDSLTPR